MNQTLLERVAQVRAFNRLYTRVIGVLGEGHLGSPYSLSEARVLYELAQETLDGTCEVTELRKRLGLDAGYASRLLTKLTERGLVTRERSTEDARRQVVRLTDTGKAGQRVLEERTVTQIAKLLEPLDEEEQRRLLASMRTISRLVDGHGPGGTLVLRPPRLGELGWIVQRHADIYAREYGWGASLEALTARIVADYAERHDPAREAAWIAELDGERAGCVLCVRGSDDRTAKLRLLMVEPAARGHGIGGKLVAECLEFARTHGYTAMELWTQEVLIAARNIYRRAGFELVESKLHRDFGEEVVGEMWRREL
jgi:DNA-binding MarR family transcriptional regulator/GNAT superfamily N-acetyltransferase